MTDDDELIEEVLRLSRQQPGTAKDRVRLQLFLARAESQDARVSGGFAAGADGAAGETVRRAAG